MKCITLWLLQFLLHIDQILQGTALGYAEFD